MSPQLAALMPDLKRGVRAAIATVVPFFLARQLGRPELSWIALGGWFASLADPGGTVRSRADAMAVFLAVATLAIAAGESVAERPIASTIWIGAVTWLASLARSFGGVASNLGTIIAIVATIATVGHISAAVASVLFGIGVVWAAVMSTLVWHGNPNLPLRHAVARAYEALAEYVDSIGELVAARDIRRDRWATMSRRRQRPVRVALEAGRSVMVELRARHTGVTNEGTNTRALLGEAEVQYFGLIAYADELEHAARHQTLPVDEATLEELERCYRAVRDQLLTRRPSTRYPPGDVAPTSQLGARLLDASRTAVEVSRDLDATAVAASPTSSLDAPRGMTLATSTELTWRTLSVRHAFRVSAAAVVATIVGRAVSPEHWQWVAITTIGVLQPYLGPTFARVVERVIGTILGAAIALGMIVALDSALATAFAMFPLVLLAVVTRPRSYRLFVLFLTPAFVLVADRWQPDVQTTMDRILDVALGGAISIVVAILVPSWERQRLPEAMGAALDTVAGYVRTAFDYLQHGGDREQLLVARRNVGITVESAEASLERMLAEPRTFRRGAEESMFILTYTRRITNALTAFEETRSALGVAPPMPPTDAVRDYLLAAIDAAKRLVTTGQPTALREPPDVERSLARFVHQAQLLARGQSIASRPTAMA